LFQLKSRELTDILVERDRLKNEADRVRQQYEEEINRIRKELNETKESLIDMSKNKGAEVAAIVSRFNSEKGEMEDLLKVSNTLLRSFFFRGLSSTPLWSSLLTFFYCCSNSNDKRQSMIFVSGWTKQLLT
jgi:hypothetical protein